MPHALRRRDYGANGQGQCANRDRRDSGTRVKVRDRSGYAKTYGAIGKCGETVQFRPIANRSCLNHGAGYNVIPSPQFLIPNPSFPWPASKPTSPSALVGRRIRRRGLFHVRRAVADVRSGRRPVRRLGHVARHRQRFRHAAAREHGLRRRRGADDAAAPLPALGHVARVDHPGRRGGLSADPFRVLGDC